MTRPRHRSVRSAAGFARISRALVWLVLSMAAVGCRTWNPSPLDLAEPGWKVSRGMAVWRPAGRELELAGEFLLATDAPHRAYVQFSKSPLILAEARADEDRWLASFPTPGRTMTGSGEPPGRLAWNQILRVALGGTPAEGWAWTGSLTDRWRLAHAGTGEWIEGTLVP